MATLDIGTLFKPAVKADKSLKCAIQGPSGSGKTLGALKIARGLGAKRIALLDTENKSASLYGDRYAFDSAPMTYFDSKRGIEVIRGVAEAKYDILIIDSFSHFWIGPGGILQMKEKMDAQNPKGGYAHWAKLTPLWDALIREIVNSPIHIICTMRSKQGHSQEKDPVTGKTQVRKIGLEPQIRDGVEYEFDLVMDLNPDHTVSPGKDRLGIFEKNEFEAHHDPITEELGEKIIKNLKGEVGSPVLAAEQTKSV